MEKPHFFGQLDYVSLHTMIMCISHYDLIIFQFFVMHMAFSVLVSFSVSGDFPDGPY
jgi:hypothetical protein